jgi:hypothetical protein
MKPLFHLFLIGATLMFSACAGPSIETYAKQEPKLLIEDYFNGPIKAWGMVQDRSGKVTRRFSVDMKGTWEGDKGKLEEFFVYDDGETQERTWYITKLANGTYEGTAGDIIGKATGRAQGNAVQWGYVMNLKVKDKYYHVTFDDWMFLMDEKNLINRSYIKKFGVRMADLTIFMQKP